MQAEHDREGVFHVHGLAVLGAGYPVGHGAGDAQGFRIQAGGDALDDFGVGHLAFGVDDDRYYHSSLYVIGVGFGRIADVLAEVLHQSRHAAGKFGHLVRNFIYFARHGGVGVSVAYYYHLVYLVHRFGRQAEHDGDGVFSR